MDVLGQPKVNMMPRARPLPRAGLGCTCLDTLSLVGVPQVMPTQLRRAKSYAGATAHIVAPSSIVPVRKPFSW